MKKIPTLFERNPDDRRQVLPVVHPGCEWVLAGEGVATRKYDGTCVMFDGAHWWARREVKPGKPVPDGFDLIGTDDATGKTVGWEPAEQSGFHRWLGDALAADPTDWTPGTYELCGPKVNGNPEGYPHHVLRSHDHAEPVPLNRLPLPASDADAYRYFASVAPAATLHSRPFEGIVWHHPDGRMAKLKWKDFPR